MFLSRWLGIFLPVVFVLKLVVKNFFALIFVPVGVGIALMELLFGWMEAYRESQISWLETVGELLKGSAVIWSFYVYFLFIYFLCVCDVLLEGFLLVPPEGQWKIE